MDWLEFLAFGLAADSLASEEEWQRERDRLECEKAELERELDKVKEEADSN